MTSLMKSIPTSITIFALLAMISIGPITSAPAADEPSGAKLPDVSVPVSTDNGVTPLEPEAPSPDITVVAQQEKIQQFTGISPNQMSPDPQSEPQIAFRPEEQAGGKTLADASAILNTTMDVMDFRDEDLQDVLRLIAAKSRLNIIMKPGGVQGKVTLHLENVKLGVALENILKTNGLAYVVSAQDNIVRIVDAASVGLQKIETKTEVVQLNWVAAPKLVKTLNDLYGDTAKIVPNQDTNSLIITATPPDLTIIKDLIKKADIAERQVLIEARLVELTEGAQKSLGANISAWRRDSSGNSPVSKSFNDKKSGSFSTSNETITNTTESGGGDPLTGTPPTTTQKIVKTVTNVVAPDSSVAVEAAADVVTSNFGVDNGGKGLDWAFGDVVNIFGQSFNIAGQIQALETSNLVELLACPRVVTLNNILAKIKIIEDIPYTEPQIGVSGATTNKVEFKQAGVEINVTPIITANGFVRMNLLTLQDIFIRRQGSDPLAPPVIDHREANTNVIVRGGDTVMIGGLRQLRTEETSESVPWFGDIPVIGWLFKNKANDDQKTELVLFVTPHHHRTNHPHHRRKGMVRPHRHEMAPSRLLLRRCENRNG